VAVIVWQLDLQLSVQSVPMTSKVVARTGEVYSTQHYVIKFFSDVTGRWFSPGTLVTSSNKTLHLFPLSLVLPPFNPV
jgi:hypothetical protein